MVKIKIWETPFKDGNIEIISTVWEEYADNELSIKIYHMKSKSIYLINFKYISAYRMLDEHGLLEIWGERDKQSLQIVNTYLVKGHIWSEESIISFLQAYQDGYSFLIATEGMCVEIIAPDIPLIQMIKK